MDMQEICNFRASSFTLPGNLSADRYILPVSGGADSTALAVLLHEMFPQAPFEMIFTDTLAESPDIWRQLDALEQYLGKKITRIVPEKGLYELVEDYGGFMPSAQARYCTRMLKLLPFREWLKRCSGQQKWMFVGIRADEGTRITFTIDECETVMPFVEMGIRREQVFEILARSVGVPMLYRYRSRSGCSPCPFQRRSEIVGLLHYERAEFDRAAGYEKIAEADRTRHQEAPALWQDSGIAANWLTLPRPAAGEIEGSARTARKDANLALFGAVRGMFVGAEFFMDGLLADDEFIWHQRVVSFSPTLAQIKRQIDDRWRLLLSTSETWGMTQDEVRRKARFAIYFVELPEAVFDPDRPEGYTWRPGESFAQVRHVTQWVTRALHAEGLHQEATRKAKSEISWLHEDIEASKAGMSKIRHETGTLVASAWYEPNEAEPEESEEDVVLNTPCPMCHL
ncbi:MAG: phosphoadenosine phosphosulfate reductase family protein [Rhodocyclaceae bacterium]|nr:phosphoadenosine phosphosulfate reductase family protein [Rhodocyclaceae bacterium]